MKHRHALEEQKENIAIHYEKYLKTETKKLMIEFENDKRKLERQLTQYKEELDRLKRSRDSVDFKMALFKIRQAGIIRKFI